MDRLGGGYNREFTQLISDHNRECAKLKSDYDSECAQLRSDHDRGRAQLISDHNRECAQLKSDHDSECAKLWNRIGDLENNMLISTERIKPIPDSTLRTRFDKLRKAVGHLSRCAMDAEQKQVEMVSDQRGLIGNMPPKHWRYPLEGKLWSILVDALFSTPFRVLGSRGEPFSLRWSNLFQKGRLKRFLHTQ